MEATDMQDRLRKSLQIIKSLQKQLAEKCNGERVSILGASFTLPFGNDSYHSLWKTLCQKKHAITSFPAERMDLLDLSVEEIEHVRGGFIDSIDQFDPGFFNMGLEEARAMDPQHRILLEQVWRAFEDSNISIEEYRGKKVGVYVALSNNDYSFQRLRTGQEKSPYDFTGNILATAAGRISYSFDFRGPALVVDTACSSALVAMDQAYNALIEGRCDLAVVAGVNLILDLRINEVLRQIEATSPEGFCRPLDASANGYTRSEGGAAFILKRTTDVDTSWEKPLCDILGSATNHDGKSNGFTAPNGKAQEAVIRDALRNAGIRPSDIDLIELHGTGTKLGDPIEIEAIRNVFTADPRMKKLLLGAVKSNLGHLECAAGFAGLAKAILCLQHKALPPTVNINLLNPLIHWHNDLEVPLETKIMQDYEKITAGISSFGISGTNAHLIISSVRESKESQKNRPVLPLLISAPSEDKLISLIEIYKQFLASADCEWSDICSASAVGRKHWTHRASIIAGSVAEALEKLESGQIAQTNLAKKDTFKEYGNEGSASKEWLVALDIQKDYLSGKDILWKEVFPPITKRTALPGMPFSKRQCWVFKNPIVDSGTVIGKTLTHPFLKKIIQPPSESRTHHFIGSIDINEQRWLDGHRLFDQIVFPGAGIHDLAHFAGQSICSEPIQVNQLRIIEPVFIDKPVTIWIELKQDGSKYAGVLLTRSKGKKWIRNSSFDISPREKSAVRDDIPLEGRPMDIRNFYERCESIGINYKDRFAQLREVTYHQRFLKGRIVEPTVENDFIIAPDVLDNCFQVLGVWLMHQFGSKAFVPTDTRTFRLYQRPQGPVEITVKLPEKGLENGKLTASFSIHASNGLCAELIDFSVMQVDMGQILKSKLRLDDHLYEIQWESEDIHYGNPAATSIPSFDSTFENSQLLERSARTLTGLDALADAFVAHILCEMGMQQKRGKKLQKSHLCKEFNVSNKHIRLFTRILDIGVENEWLSEMSDHYVVEAMPQPDMIGAIERFRAEYPHALMELKVLSDCAFNIPLILTGRKDPLEILFPEGSTEILSSFYNCDPFLIMYELCKDSLEAWLKENEELKKIRILEIGAGTGSTTKRLLPILRGLDITYEFTDVSPLFLTVAQEELKDHPFITYRLLNIEEAIGKQGFEVESYDLIIASNVLHATRDLSNTFRNVSALLKEKGSLFMLEGNVAMKWIDLIFGLTSGWWLFNDSHLRPKHATLNVPDWERFLTSSGFISPQFLEPFFEGKTASGQSVIWTQKSHIESIDSSNINDPHERGGDPTKHIDDRRIHHAPHVIEVDSEAEGLNSEQHTGILLELVEKLKCLHSEDPTNKRLFIFHRASAPNQMVGFWRVLQNEWKDWDINLVLTDDLSPTLIQAEITTASKGDCSRWNHSKREVLRLKKAALNNTGGLDLRKKKVLVTGASGGLAQAVISWLLDKGVSRIIGVSRSRGSEEIIDRRIEYHYADVIDWIDNADLTDIFAIFHLAGTLDNQLVIHQTSQSISNVLRPKIDGAIKLRHAAVSNSIPHLIHFASSASWLGTVGQANHAYANFDLTDIDSPTSLKEISILWGAWSTTGAVVKYDAGSWVSRIGMSPIETLEGLDLLDQIIGSGCRELGVFQLDWATYQKVMKTTPFLQDLTSKQDPFAQSIQYDIPSASFRDLDEISAWLEVELSHTLGYESKQTFDHNAGFFDLGLDSLTTMDLVKRIETRIQAKMPATILFKYPTIKHLSGFILEQYVRNSHKMAETDEPMKEEAEAIQFIDDLFNDMIDENR